MRLVQDVVDVSWRIGFGVAGKADSQGWYYGRVERLCFFGG